MVGDQSFLSLTESFLKTISEITNLQLIICDKDGKIIQANDKSRIGTTHSGAQKILKREVDECAITSEEASGDPYIKEGYSCPISLSGQRIGTFGVTGPLSVSEPLAKLSAVLLSYRIKELNQKQKLQETAEEVFTKTDKINNEIEEAAIKSENIIDRIEKATEKTLYHIKLSDEILNKIQSISQKSHILTINGSIVASRAGQFGQSFAVVAKEMRKLATETSLTADEIQSNLTNIHVSITDLSEAIQQSFSVTKENMNMMQEAIDIFKSLRSSISELNKNF